MSVAVGRVGQAEHVNGPRHVVVARPFILTCLSCGPAGAFEKADTQAEAEEKARRHARVLKHDLGRIYFDRAWGFKPRS